MIEYGRAPVGCVKAANDLEPETKYAAKSGAVVARKATARDIARIEAEIAAKAARADMNYSITAEMGLKKKPGKRPEIPFEEMAVRSRVAKNVKFERVAG